MELQEVLRSLEPAAETFKNGTQLTSLEEIDTAVHQMDILLTLVRHAKFLGATPYEIECAMKGDFVGSSFL